MRPFSKRCRFLSPVLTILRKVRTGLDVVSIRMAGEGSDKKNVTGVGKALAAFIKANKISVAALGRALSEVEEETDPESCRRKVQRWLKGPSLRGASMSNLEDAFKRLGARGSFEDFRRSYSQPPPLPNPLPESFEEWFWLARHDYTYIQCNGEGDTHWDEELDRPVFWRPSAAELNEGGKKLAKRVWTFFKRISYRWERDDLLDRVYRRWSQRFDDELRYRRCHLEQNLDYDSVETSITLAAWLACREFCEKVDDPNWEPATADQTAVSHDEVLLRAEYEGPTYAAFSSGHWWPGTWIEAGTGFGGIFSEEEPGD